MKKKTKKLIKKKVLSKSKKDKKKPVKKKPNIKKKAIIVKKKKTVVVVKAKKTPKKSVSVAKATADVVNSELSVINGVTHITKKSKSKFRPLSELKFDSVGEEYLFLQKALIESKVSELLTEKPTIEELRHIYQHFLVKGGKEDLSKKYEKTSIYWSDVQEQALVDFLKETNEAKKNRIFKQLLYKPLIKLVENIIFNFKLFRSDVEIAELQHDCISFLITKIEKFDPTTGARAFAYLGTIAKHYLMGEKRVSYKMTKNNLDIDANMDEASSKPEYVYLIDQDKDEIESENKMFDNVIVKLEEEIRKPKILPNDKKVIETILDIFKRHDEIGVYNKNLLYHLIKERTGLQTKDITYSLGRLKHLYKLFKIDFININNEE